MRLKTISLVCVIITGLLAGPVWSMAPSGASEGNSVSVTAGDMILAKEIDIHLKKETGPKEEDPAIQLEKKMPETPPVKQEETFEEDPFASDEELDKAEEEEDSLEDVNRAMHDVNDTIYQYFFKPLAKGYRDVMPDDGRKAVRNFFDNLKSPSKLVSSAIQGDGDKSERVVSRFLINTTLGMGGLIDVAGEEYEIKNVNEDFEQALAVQGVESGDYIVLPVLGPTTTRGVVGTIVDNALNPASYFGVGFLANAAINTTERVNETSYHVEDIDQLNESAVDPYQAQRHFYLQLREKQIKE